MMRFAGLTDYLNKKLGFVEGTDNWSLGDNTNPDVINVMINNSGDQARVTVTVASS